MWLRLVMWSKCKMHVMWGVMEAWRVPWGVTFFPSFNNEAVPCILLLYLQHRAKYCTTIPSLLRDASLLGRNPLSMENLDILSMQLFFSLAKCTRTVLLVKLQRLPNPPPRNARTTVKICDGSRRRLSEEIAQRQSSQNFLRRHQEASKRGTTRWTRWNRNSWNPLCP